MRELVPIYSTPAGVFQADVCRPLVEAVERSEVELRALVHGHYPGCKLPPRSLPGVKTVGHWDAAGAQSWGLPWHRNEGIEITFLESGRVAFAVDGREITLSPGSLAITRPWQTHRVGNPRIGPGKLHWLILDVGVRRPNQDWKWPSWCMLSQADLKELETALRQTEQPVWTASGDLRRCFQKISNAVQTSSPHSPISELGVHINELLLLLLTLFRKHRPALNKSLTSTERTVELFLADLRDHPEHLSLEWTVEEMAQSCGLGVTRFIHLVKQITNFTPLRYLNDCRLSHAAKLLRSASAPSVTGVAQDCGFSSSQYFATVFRRRFGCAPSDFRAVQSRSTPSS